MVTVILVGSCGSTFEVTEKIANMSETIKDLMEKAEEKGDPLRITFDSIPGKILSKVIDWATHYENDPAAVEDDHGAGNTLSDWDKDFVKTLDDGTLFEMIVAANFLKMKVLEAIVVNPIAAKIKGKSPEEIRQGFGIHNDFKEDEEKQTRIENEWKMQY